jgi:hypothetical protein
MRGGAARSEWLSSRRTPDGDRFRRRNRVKRDTKHIGIHFAVQGQFSGEVAAVHFPEYQQWPALCR